MNLMIKSKPLLQSCPPSAGRKPTPRTFIDIKPKKPYVIESVDNASDDTKMILESASPFFCCERTARVKTARTKVTKAVSMHFKVMNTRRLLLATS